MGTCKLKARKDDIPKLSKREKSWYCETCGALAFAEQRPICLQPAIDAAHASAAFEKDRLHIED